MIALKAEVADRERLQRQRKKLTGVVDPLTRTLMNYEDEEDLNAKIDTVYCRLDADGGGSLSFDELRSGLKKMGIHLSYDDWEIITDQGRLTDDDDSFDRMGFREIMRGELWRFMRRELMNMGQSGSEEFKVQQIWQKLLDSKLTRLMHEVEVVELNLPRRRSAGGQLRSTTEPSSRVEADAAEDPAVKWGGGKAVGEGSVGGHASRVVAPDGKRAVAEQSGEGDRLSSLAEMITKQAEAQAEAVGLMQDMFSQLRSDLELKFQQMEGRINELAVASKGTSDNSTSAPGGHKMRSAEAMLERLPLLSNGGAGSTRHRVVAKLMTGDLVHIPRQEGDPQTSMQEAAKHARPFVSSAHQESQLHRHRHGKHQPTSSHRSMKGNGHGHSPHYSEHAPGSGSEPVHNSECNKFETDQDDDPLDKNDHHHLYLHDQHNRGSWITRE